MVRTRSEKDQLVESIREVFEQAQSLFLVSLAGLSSNDVNKLRKTLRRNGAHVRVVKNRLAKRAAADGPIAKIEQWLRGPTAVVFHPTDAVAMAKDLVDFAKEHPELELRAGLLDRSQVVAGGQVKAVAELPTLDQARAMLLGVITAPATQLLRVINASGGQLARVLDARRTQLGDDAGAEG
jgi:large subunit ribosomal protein L10